MESTDAPPRTAMRKVRLIIWGLVALAAGISAAVWMFGAPQQPATPAESYANAVGGAFSMTDQAGKTITNETLKGKPFVLFFGFTRCPDVCPTTLSRMAQLRKALGADGDKFNIVFVSVDQEHDKPADIGRYLTLFDTPIIGLSGTPEQLKRIAKAYHVYYEKVEQPGGGTTMDHTATVFLMGKQGEFVTTIDSHEGQDTALDKLRRIIHA